MDPNNTRPRRDGQPAAGGRSSSASRPGAAGRGTSRPAGSSQARQQAPAGRPRPVSGPSSQKRAPAGQPVRPSGSAAQKHAPAGQPVRPSGPPAQKRSSRRNARSAAALRVVLCILVLAFCVVLGLWVSGIAGSFLPAPGGSVQTGEQAGTAQSGGALTAGAVTSDLPENTPAADPTPDPAQERIAQVTARNGENATLNATQATDPDTWNASALTILEGLQTQYPDLDLTVQEDFPYLLAVNREAGVVTVYASDNDPENPRYTVPYLAMVCSGGPDTPTGVYNTPVSYDWRLLSGPCYGQYATRIWDAYLFHSVPYYTQHKDDLEYVEFNKLGTQASLGCIRLMVVDVKWIYDNCPIGTTVVIYDDAATPGPMGTPGTIYIDPDDETYRGWDPTDPDAANPWDEHYRTGTTIRSEAAWAEWDAAQDDGRWHNTINPADLQGYSTDYKTEGTRG